jgi:predicted AlkP superfamily pyrophosphatase or phosphodiesterase
MKNLTTFVLSFCSLFLVSQENPKILVSIVVDQMKYEYVDRFWDEFGEKGIKKLVNEGVFCRNTHYNYIPTYTGPGHASIFTGTTPSVHGIIGNNWYSRKDFSPVYCAGDWASQTVCLCKKPHEKTNPGSGKMSPISLLCNTVGDQLKIKDSLSKVFGVSIKDRGAILSTGTLADGAYWLNYDSKWITSSFYRKNLPDWMVQFHNNHSIKSYMNNFWTGTTFKYDLNKMFAETGPSAIKATPKGNNYTLDFSKALIKNEKLGTDQHTDLLVISFSSTDYVGHKFGPDAEEVKSMYLNLDQQITELIQFLESHCGTNQFIISLTSDHGAGTSPVVIEKKRLKGGNFISREIFPELNTLLELKFGVPDILARYSNMQFYINYQKLDSLNILNTEIFDVARNWLKKQPSIDEVYSANTLSNSLTSLKTKSLINGIYPNRSGDIFFTLKPGYIEWSTKTGTTHGTHYNYDSHVPLLFYGYNIQPKQIYRNIKIIDIAPTLSILLRSAFPNACTGNPISEVFQN